MHEDVTLPSGAGEEAWGLRRGDSVGRYVVVSALGSGGMGTVYSAFDPELDRRVAIKLLLSSVAKNEASRARLQREARSMAKLRHPNIVTIYDAGEHEGHVFIAMEYVEGRTLGRWRQEEEPGWEGVVRVFAEAGRGLAAAHARGIVHRDFKPDNVMVGDDGRVLVMDFGLAHECPPSSDSSGAASAGSSALGAQPGTLRPDSDRPDLTVTGALVGTPAYMSPEQHMFREVGPASDQFSFCVSLFEALFGRRPFTGSTTDELAASICAHRIVPPPPRVVPAWLRDLVLRGLRPDPVDRFPSMDALLSRLDRRPVGGRRAIVGLALAAVVGGLGGLYRLAMPGASTCERGSHTVEDRWLPARQAKIHRAFETALQGDAEAAWQRTQRAVEDFSTRWSDAFVEICDATRVRGSVSERQFEVRVGCLSERASGLDAMLDALESADAGLALNASTLIASLQRPDECLTKDELVADPPSESERELVDAVRISLARLRARNLASQHEAVLGTIPSILGELEGHDLPELQARAHDVWATALSRTDRMDQALAAHKEAIRWAEQTDDFVQRAWCWLNLLQTLATRTHRFEEAKALMMPTELAVEAAGDVPLLRATLLRVKGQLAVSLGKNHEAVALLTEAVHVTTDRELSAHQRELARSNLGLALREIGEYEASEEHLRAALAIAYERVGAQHPSYADILVTLGKTCWDLQRAACARDSMEEALRILRRTTGARSSRYGRVAFSLADIEFQSGNLDEAADLLATAEQIFVAQFGPRDPLVAATEVMAGNIELERGNPGAALPHYERGEELFTHQLGATHPHLAIILNGIGEASRRSGRRTDALHAFDRALAVADRTASIYETVKANRDATLAMAREG